MKDEDNDNDDDASLIYYSTHIHCLVLPSIFICGLSHFPPLSAAAFNRGCCETKIGDGEENFIISLAPFYCHDFHHTPIVRICLH